jgi:hypothetical protein
LKAPTSTTAGTPSSTCATNLLKLTAWPRKDHGNESRTTVVSSVGVSGRPAAPDRGQRHAWRGPRQATHVSSTPPPNAAKLAALKANRSAYSVELILNLKKRFNDVKTFSFLGCLF